MGMEVEIPEPQQVSLDPKTTAVIVVDMQNDFAHPKGSLFVKTAPDTIPRIKSVVEKAREAGARIIYTQDWHAKDDPEFRIWGVHAVAGTWGAEIVDELKPSEDDVVIKKLRYDAFYGTSLEHILRLHNIKNTVITGTVANICVLHTAGSAALRWFNVVVPVDCISALTEFDYKAALRQITFLYRGTLTKSNLISFV